MSGDTATTPISHFINHNRSISHFYPPCCGYPHAGNVTYVWRVIGERSTTESSETRPPVSPIMLIGLVIVLVSMSILRAVGFGIFLLVLSSIMPTVFAELTKTLLVFLQSSETAFQAAGILASYAGHIPQPH